jgi:uncharacterized protein (TIGR02271 family)
MASHTNDTVVGVFRNSDDARSAIQALKEAGFREDEIGLASSRQEGFRDATNENLDADLEADDTYAASGAATGLAAGAGMGALWGLGILAGVLPAIGPAIAGGTLAAILSSAAAGAAAAGIAGALIGMGIPKDEAEFYESEVKAGRTVVSVNAGSRRSEAIAILQRFGGYDMSTRGDADFSTRDEYQSTDDARHLNKGNTIQARAEQLNVQKTPVEVGDVRVRKEVHTEHKSVDVPVMREEVVIERHPVSGRQASSEPLNEGQEIRIPVREEEVNIQKETVVTDEVSVGKRQVQDTKHVNENLRKESIKVDTEGNVNVRDERKR